MNKMSPVVEKAQGQLSPTHAAHTGPNIAQRKRRGPHKTGTCPRRNSGLFPDKER